ncbi:phosphorylase family protein [Rhizobium sp. A37_96]
MSSLVTGITADSLSSLVGLKNFALTFVTDFEIEFLKAPVANKSLFAVCVLKPKKEIEIMFGLSQPILAIYFVESYLKIDLNDIVSREYKSHKQAKSNLDPRFVFIASSGKNAVAATDYLTMFATESFIYVPFSINSSGRSAHVKHTLFNSIGIKNYYDNTDPIKSDQMFFGRQRLLTQALGATREGQNIGLFGLRRVGKTSILFSLERSFRDRKIGKILLYSLDDPARAQARWYIVLSQLAALIDPNAIRERFDEHNASSLFKTTVQKFLNANVGQNLVIAFDEIEHIVPGTAKAPHWNSDYFFLMDHLRALTREITKFSIVVCGINARALESAHLNGVPNPVFNGMSILSVPMFTLEEASLMVSRLGLYMGIMFKPEAMAQIHREYGGHPLLMRQFCSELFNKLQRERVSWPFTIDVDTATDQIRTARPQLHYWASYVLQTLKDFYPDEYDMLRMLSHGEVDFYESMEMDNPDLANHLRGYGLVTGHPPTLSMPFLKHYLAHKEARSVMDDSTPSVAATKKKVTLPNESSEYDFAILAALDEELEAFMRALPKSKVRQLPSTANSPFTLYAASVAVSKAGRIAKILLCTPEKVGSSSVQNLVHHINQRFKVKNYILIGICAGRKGKVNLGDIIIADQVIDYSLAKFTNDGVENRPTAFPTSPWLNNAAKRFKSYKWPPSYLPQEIGAVRSGNLASGPIVFADDKSFEQLWKTWPVIGVEMEAAGAVGALYSTGRTDFLVIKAVSDFGDSSKSDAVRYKCCEASAHFALQLIRKTPLPEASL